MAKVVLNRFLVKLMNLTIPYKIQSDPEKNVIKKGSNKLPRGGLGDDIRVASEKINKHKFAKEK